MRHEGSLIKWNAERGFGFIKTNEETEVFVHISAFPNKNSVPRIGEKLSFSIKTDENGKTSAFNLIYQDRIPTQKPTKSGLNPPKTLKQIPHNTSRGKFGLNKIASILLLVAIALGVYAYGKYADRSEENLVEISENVVLSVEPSLANSIEKPAPKTILTPSTTTFRCDGRMHCSQMTSCAEATYFLQNCPNTKMDGNQDGVPCEQQWCKK